MYGRRLLRLGLVGLGRWGQTYLNCCAQHNEIKVVVAVGRKYQEICLFEFSGIRFAEHYSDIAASDELDGIIVATSPESHYEIVKYFLERGLPVLVEKPFTLSSNKTDELRALAEGRGVICMVGYTHCYSPGFIDLKSCVLRTSGLLKIFTESYSDGPIRKNVPVLWDWGSHDIALCIDLLGSMPVTIGIDWKLMPTQTHDSQLICFTMIFSGSIVATCVVGNASGYKRRDFTAVCKEGTFTYDGFSRGLSKKIPLGTETPGPLNFKCQLSPLECVLSEFAKAINLGGKTQHPSLALSSRVNQVLQTLELVL